MKHTYSNWHLPPEYISLMGVMTCNGSNNAFVKVISNVVDHNLCDYMYLLWQCLVVSDITTLVTIIYCDVMFDVVVCL